MTELHSPYEWCKRLSVQIMDPDGWRGAHGRSWDDLITEDEFNLRAAESTTMSSNRWVVETANRLYTAGQKRAHDRSELVKGLRSVDGYVVATLHCSALREADCWLTCVSDHSCTSWSFDGDCELVDCGHCNAIDYIGNCGAVSEFYKGPQHAVVDGPCVIEWDASDEVYTWRYDDGSV